MTNVSTSKTSFTPYKWDTAVFSWDSDLALSSWDSAGISSWQIEVSGDSFSITDKENNTFSKNWKGSVSIKESMNKEIAKQIASALTIAEAFSRLVNYGIAAKEAFSLSEKLSKAVSVSSREAFHIDEYTNKEIGKNSIDSFGVAEVFNREARYYLNIDEVQNIADSISKEYGLTNKESLSVIDDYYRASNMVISDIAFFDGEKAISELSGRDVPVGFAPFREFIPGDWLYKDAIFKMVIESTDATASPGVSEWKLNIDVPDVFDKGTYECKAGKSSSITFSRRFWDIPDVTIKIRGENSALLHIENLVTTVEGFTFDLMNSSNAKVAGSIYWKAEGY